MGSSLASGECPDYTMVQPDTSLVPRRPGLRSAAFAIASQLSSVHSATPALLRGTLFLLTFAAPETQSFLKTC